MTRIVADTTCGLDPDVARQLGIPLISQIITFGAESFREGVDMDHAAFMARLKAGRELPKTAAPYPGDFIEAFTDLTQDRRERRVHPPLGGRQRDRPVGGNRRVGLPRPGHPHHRHAHHCRPVGEHGAGSGSPGQGRRERR